MQSFRDGFDQAIRRAANNRASKQRLNVGRSHAIGFLCGAAWRAAFSFVTCFIRHG
jgi:hypothetical protein